MAVLFLGFISGRVSGTWRFVAWFFAVSHTVCALVFYDLGFVLVLSLVFCDLGFISSMGGFKKVGLYFLFLRLYSYNIPITVPIPIGSTRHPKLIFLGSSLWFYLCEGWFENRGLVFCFCAWGIDLESQSYAFVSDPQFEKGESSFGFDSFVLVWKGQLFFHAHLAA